VKFVGGWSVLILPGLLGLFCWQVMAEERTNQVSGASWLTPETCGFHYGAGANNSASQFNKAEAYLNCNTRWNWELGKEWFCRPQLASTAGWLGDGKDAAIFSLGPNLVLGRQGLPLSVDGGVSPTMMTRHEFETKDFGMNFAFVTHAGLNLDLSRKVRLGYRYEHMSNAHLGPHNAGLNIMMVALGYRFP
jgi:hypothetical protein